ncbi:ELMO domain-containing protein 3 [Brachionichthys hirsutus]|uniref:ELMO domain-containing protein 3 n=1 Tax=Brachionichthys hirsutus TaxID=412623 RepID=UPI003605345F
MEGDVAVPSCTEGLNGLSRECRPLEDITNGHSNRKAVMNGLITSRRVEDYGNGGALLASLPISALKQNGLLQSLTAGGDPPTPTEEDVELEKARQEWEVLDNGPPGLAQDPNPTPIISFNEALQFFQTTDLGDLLMNIQPTIRRAGLAALTHFLFGPPRLHRELLEERGLVFAIAQCQVDNSQAVHMRVLQTIYKRLVGSRLDCPRYGAHWEGIGFQGVDPATDLRGTGFLGLMHPLYFVMDPETLPLARDIYKLSQHPAQNFPFSVMSINMTRIVLQVLREEALSRECNRRQQVVGVLNDFYVATYLYLYQLWKTQQKTIADSGFVLKEVELFAKKNPKQMLRRLELFLKERRAGGTFLPDPQDQHPTPSMGRRGGGSVVGRGGQGKETHFTGVCDLTADVEGGARLI